jgi:SAM-dependent methyltransferase
MSVPVWKDAEVVAKFAAERAVRVPEAPTQMAVLLHLLRCWPERPRRVLDLGSGDGLVLATVLEALPESSGVAVDFSPPMLARARARLRPFGPRCAIVEADLGDPAWQAAVVPPFDAVVSGFAIHHLPDARKRALYGEVYAFLRPGGIFLNLEHVASATPVVERLADEAIVLFQHRQRRGAGEEVTLEVVRHEHATRPDRAANVLAPVDVQCQWLRDLGFVDVDCFWKYFEFALFGGARAARPACS